MKSIRKKKAGNQQQHNVLSFPVKKPIGSTSARRAKRKLSNNVVQFPRRVASFNYPTFKTINMGFDLGELKKGDSIIYELGTWEVGELVIVMDIDNLPMIGKLAQIKGQYYLEDGEGESFSLNGCVESIAGQVVGRLFEKGGKKCQEKQR